MKVVTWNVNGIRAREAQVLDLVKLERPDILCLQEVKASPEQVPRSLCELEGYWCYWHGHKGYSGVGLHLRKERFPDEPAFHHPEFDHEHRIVAAQLGPMHVASLYVPNGGKDFPAKVRFMEAMDAFLKQLLAEGKEVLWCGDLNVARLVIDIYPSMRKPDQIGQTPGERAIFERWLAHGLTDLHRKFEPENDRLYTWWAPWRDLKKKNVGWRLDYLLTSKALTEAATSCKVLREFGTSDHGPVVAEFKD